MTCFHCFFRTIHGVLRVVWYLYKDKCKDIDEYQNNEEKKTGQKVDFRTLTTVLRAISDATQMAA